MSVRAWVTAGVGAMVVGAMAGCSSSTADPPSPSTASSSTSSSVTSSSTSTTSSSSSTTPDSVATAEDTVLQLYKELDAVAQGKGEANRVLRHAGAVKASSGTDTYPKWTKFLDHQRFDKVTQVGDTLLSQITGQPTAKPKADRPIDEAFVVTACVDRSGLTYTDAKGNSVDYAAGALSKSWVSHLVTETNGKFFVARDDPGKSC